MNVHYKEDKSPVGLSGKWAIPIANYHIDCYVWVNKDALLNNVAHEDEDFVGCYVHFPFRKLAGGLFGEIHMLETEAKPGTVAHELTHALLDYIQHTLGPVREGNKLNETLCNIMETMTETFWREYFDVFVPQEPTPEVESSVVSDVVNSPEPEVNPVEPEIEVEKVKTSRKRK